MSSEEGVVEKKNYEVLYHLEKAKNERLIAVLDNLRKNIAIEHDWLVDNRIKTALRSYVNLIDLSRKTN